MIVALLMCMLCAIALYGPFMMSSEHTGKYESEYGPYSRTKPPPEEHHVFSCHPARFMRPGGGSAAPAWSHYMTENKGTERKVRTGSVSLWVRTYCTHDKLAICLKNFKSFQRFSERFPKGFLRATRKFPKGFLRLSREFAKGFLRVS